MYVISFRWRNYEPEIVFDTGLSVPLLNQQLDFLIGKRFCIGYFKNGKRHPCPENNEVTNGYQCELCKKLDDVLPCVQCVGFCRNLKKRIQCMKQQYYVYLATFGDILKVGISHKARVKQRLIEQGADFGVKLFKIEDGAVARREEQRIKKLLGIVDRVQGNEKHKNMLLDLDTGIEKIQNAIEKLKKYYNVSPEIYDLREYYHIKKIKTRFVEIKEGMKISGKVVAVKGNLVVMENENISFNGRQLIGREIIPISTSPKQKV